MTNKFLLNLLGFNPDLTSRQPLPDSVSIPCRVRVLAILLLCLTIGVGNVLGAETVYKETVFNSTNNSEGKNSYGASWYNTTSGFRVNLVNASNNNNGWEYIKIGHQSTAYTGTITTNAAIDDKITKISINIGAVNSYVTSISLYISSNGSTWGSAYGTFTKSTGWQDVSIAAKDQAANLYYKIEAVCTTGGSKNGHLQINGIKYYHEAPSYTVTWISNGTDFDETSVVGGEKPTFPSPSPSSCDLTSTTFVGWTQTPWSGTTDDISGKTTAATKIYTSASQMPAVTGNVTYHAVFAKVEDNSTNVFSDDMNISGTSSVSSRSGWYSFSTAYGGNGSIRLSSSDYCGSMVTNALTSLSGTATITFKAKQWSASEYQVRLQASKGSFETSTFTTTSSFAEYSTTLTGGDGTTKITFDGGTYCDRIYIKDIVITCGSIDTTKYLTTCCTPLGSINGSINMTSSTDGTVTISDWTYAAGSTGTTESNVSSYTVKLYKLTGTSPDAWTIVSGSTSGGSSGTQGTRTGIATNSKSVTYSGLEYGATYKFTVTAIGTGSYCDGPETAVTSINGNSLTDNKFLNKYYIHIDDGTQSDSGWEDYYFTNLTSHAGSVDVTLNAFTDYYQYKLSLGGVIWWGNNSKMTSSDHTNWTLYTAHGNVKLQTAMGGTYTFGLNAATPAVTVTYPTSNQASGYHIYFDNSILEWSTLRYRIGNNSHNQNSTLALVTGTDNFYVATTPSYNGMEAWHIANNTGWANSHTIYRTATNNESGQPEIAITASIVFQQYKVTEDITVIPTTSHTTGTDNTGDKVNNQCEFYTINTPTSGMLTHTATISATTNGSINLAYTDVSGTSQNKTSTTSSLAHRTKITASAIPSTGYEISTFTVTPSGGDATNLTSGATDNHILAKDATFAATFAAKTYAISLDRNGGTTGATEVTMTYNSSSFTGWSAPSRTGYTFDGYYTSETNDNGSGTLVINSSGVLQANVDGYTGANGIWTKDATCTLYAKWTEVLHNVTVAYKCGDATVKTSTTINNVGITTTGSTTAPDINGYTWSTWSAMPSGVSTSTTPLTTKTIVINATADSKTITANYTANQYVVTLDANGGVDGATTSVTTTFGQAMPTIESANLPTREGYRFDGFYTEKSGGTQYYNADGTSARNQGRWSDNQKLFAHWVAQLTFSVNGAIDDDLTRDVTESLPSSATVPTSCGDCWAFAGWDASSTCSTTPRHAGGENAATHGITTPTTLYAVFGQAKYKMITSTDGLVANDNYVITYWYISADTEYEYALSNTAHGTWPYDATATSVIDLARINADGDFLYNVGSSNIWKFTGTSSSGQLYNAAADKYLNLSSTSACMLNTTDNLTFTVVDDIYWKINSTNNLRFYTNPLFEADASKYSGVFIYHQVSSTVTTTPSCETYDIVWKVNGTPLASGSQTEETNACAGIEELPTDPDDDELDCATKFMGWSESKLIGTGKSAPADLFLDAGDAPAINEDKTFHAVFASVDAENTMEVTDNLTYSAIGLGYAGTGETYTGFENVSSSSSAKYAGQALRFRSSYSGDGTHNYIQIKSKDSNTGIVTTSSGGLAKKVTITWNTNQSAAKAINVYGKNTAYSAASDLFNSSTYGTLLGTITYGTNTELTISGDYAFIGLCSSDGAFYMDNIAIKWESPAYKDYMTSCCDELVVLSTNSPSNGTITFDPVSPIATCDANQNVTMTITPNAGYKLSEWSVATGDGKVAASSTSPAVVTGEDNSDEQEIALVFNQHLSGTYAVSATFEQMHDEYYDYMHDNAKVGANRTGSYSAPSRTSKTAGKTANDCKGNHYKFKGWVVSTEINDDGTLKSGYTLITAGTSMTASNKIYYAVWAEEED